MESGKEPTPFLRQDRRSAHSNAMPIPDPALAFFITASTKPIEGCADKFGTCARVVLWNTPSPAAANEWARDYVNATLLCRSSQKLTELKVLPIHDRLLAAAETIEIQWPLLGLLVFVFGASVFGALCRMTSRRRADCSSSSLRFDSSFIITGWPFLYLSPSLASAACVSISSSSTFSNCFCATFSSMAGSGSAMAAGLTRRVARIASSASLAPRDRLLARACSGTSCPSRPHSAAPRPRRPALP